MADAAAPTPLQAPARPRWLRWAGRILGAALVALSVYYLGRSLAEGLRQVVAERGELLDNLAR